jgi:hypothetical protein
MIRIALLFRRLLSRPTVTNYLDHSRDKFILYLLRERMLHQENSEAFVRHHSELLACGNMRGADNGRSNFLPEKCQIAGNE